MKHMTLRGTHYEAGLQYGSALAAEGCFLPERVPFPITEERRIFARACLPAYQIHFPELLEEIRGLARGQGCGEEVLRTVLLSMYALPPACGCSCFAFSRGGQTLLGRNSDFWLALEDRNLNVRYRLSPPAHGFTGSTTAFLEVEDGVNDRALAVGLTAVAPARIKPGFNAGMLVRYLLEKCASVPQALKALETLPIASSQTLTLADGGGEIAVAECSAQGLRILRPTADRPFVHAVNRFVSDLPAPAGDDWRSGERRETLERALSAHRGAMGVDQAQALLSGKRGYLCQYDPTGGKGTVWSVIYDLTNKRIHRAEGSPAHYPYLRELFPQGAAFRPSP